MSNYFIAYTGKLSPAHQRQFLDATTGLPLNLTGVTSANFTTYAQDALTGTITLYGGTWTVTGATTGIASYQWQTADLATPGVRAIWVSIQLPSESFPREFPPEFCYILPTPEYIGGLIVSTQDVNIADVLGSAISSSNPIPTDVVDRLARVLGHVIVDTLPALAAGTNLIGSVELVDGGGTNKLAIDSSGRLTLLSIVNPLPAGTNVIGHVIVDSGTITFPAQQAVNLDQVNGSALSNTNPAPIQWVSQSGYVALTSPPTQTNAGSDTQLTFSSQVNTVIIQNNTAAVLNFAFDTAASAGSLALAAGQTFIYSKKVTSPHLYTASATNINGTSSGNIVVLGEL